jgi:hypothetical protein
MSPCRHIRGIGHTSLLRSRRAPAPARWSSAGLGSALQLVALIAVKKPEDFDRWALRWLARYVTEGCQRIEDAADVASLLEELARDPTVIEKLRGYVR